MKIYDSGEAEAARREPHLSLAERDRREMQRARETLRVNSLMLQAGLPVDPISRRELHRRLVDGLCLGAGVEPVGFRPTEGAGRFRSKGIEAVARAFCAAWCVAGEQPRSDSEAIMWATDREKMTRAVFGLHEALAAGAGDFPAILADGLGKIVLSVYLQGIRTWRRWGRVETVNTWSGIRPAWLSPLGDLPERPEGGEVHAVTGVGDDGRRYTLHEYALAERFTRRAFLGDDKGVLGRVKDFGAAARRTEDSVIYATLTSNGGLGPIMQDAAALFAPGHLNSLAGAALSRAALDDARQLLAAMTSPEGVALHLKGRSLIVPVALTDRAGEILRQIGNAELPEEDRLVLTAEPRLDLVDPEAWYLAADRAEAPVLVVFFIESEEAPVFRTEFDYLTGDMKTKVRHTFTVGFLDWRGIIRATAGSGSGSGP